MICAVDLADADHDNSFVDVLSALANYHPVRTPIAVADLDAPDALPEDVLVIDGNVCLTNGDCGCAECGALIEPDAFGSNAPFYRILTRQLSKYGTTHCPTCLSEVQSQ